MITRGYISKVISYPERLCGAAQKEWPGLRVQDYRVIRGYLFEIVLIKQTKKV